MSGANRRRYTRVRTSGVAALLQIDGSTTSVVIDNISLGGVFLRSARPMSVGTRIQLRIVRPGLKIALGVLGRVVGVLEPDEAARNGVAPGMRIEFLSVTDHVRERLGALLVELGLPPDQHLMPQRGAEAEADATPAAEAAAPSVDAGDPFAPAATVPGIRRPGAVDQVPGPSPSENPFLHRASPTTTTTTSAPTPPPAPPAGELELDLLAEAPPAPSPDENPFLKPAPTKVDRVVTMAELTISRDDSAEDEAERLMTHVRGLMMQLSEREMKIRKLEEENRRLKALLYDLEHGGAGDDEG